MAITWNIDPILVQLGPLQLRYYSLLFVSALLLGYFVWMRQAKRAGIDEKVADRFLIWGVLAVVLGSRLGHVFFYEPAHYLKHPIEILMVWKGGLASHGATIGLFVTLFLYSKRYKLPYLEITDRVTFGVAFAASFVRLGNFFNSEIVGRITDSAVGMKFPRYYAQVHRVSLDDVMKHLDQVPVRHPSQLYEALMAGVVILILFLVDRKYKEKRNLGLLSGLFLTIYFSMRFIVEYFKEYQTLASNDSLFTMGQYLSVPFIMIGVFLLVQSIRGKFNHLKYVPPAPEKPKKIKVKKKKLK